MSPPASAEITETTPLRLKDAVRLGFPHGGMTVSGLRKERDRGRLVVEKIAGKEFTTLRHINQMRELCRDNPKDPGSGSNPRRETRQESSQGAQHGSFETERKRSALDALRQTARVLSKPSRNTSSENTRSHETADVIPLKS